MKVRLYGKMTEIPDERVRGGVAHATPTTRAESDVRSDSRINGRASRADTRGVTRSAGSNPAPAPFSPPLSLCFTLWGQIRGGKNNIGITAKGHRYPKEPFVKWRDEMLKQCPPVAGPYLGPLHMIVDYVKGDLKKRDLPAMLDALLHLFGKAGYFVDDSQVVQVTLTPFPLDRKRPRCTVTLSPLTMNLDEEAP